MIRLFTPLLLTPLLILALAACDASPAPQFFGATRHETTLGGIRFVVYQTGDQAEVVRLGWLSRAERDRVPALMVRAAGQVTGCRVAGPATGLYRSPSLPGDTGEARFRLEC